MNHCFSEKLASLPPQRAENIIQLFDARDPTHLFKAIRWGEIRAVREWCKSNAIDVTTTDVAGRTVLHIGAEQGELGVFNFLLQKSGVKVDAIDSSGKTALFYAAQYERAALVQRLLCSYSASVDIRDNSGRTALSHAAECNSYRSTELLLEAGALAYFLV
jgi:ankyrin repeat protein